MTEPGQEPAPARVRVTSPQTRGATRRIARTVTTEIDAQTELGATYVRSLLRAQLRLAMGILLLLMVLLGGLPLLFAFAPTLSAHQVFGMPIAWGLLAFGVYPVLMALGWVYVRRAERTERDFIAMVEDR